MSDKEKRTFLRLQTNIRAQARKLSSPDEAPVFQGSAVYGGAASPASLSGKGIPDALVEFLLEMNSKLDMLLSIQNEDRLKRDFPLALQVTELSGAGIRFRSDREVTMEDSLEVVLLLGEYPLRMASGIGRVVRCGSSEDEVNAMEFKNIKERDIEAIVQFIFQEQREQIRGQKWGSVSPPATITRRNL